MYDNESESMTFVSSVTPDPGWMARSQNSTHVIFEGTPNDNAHAQDYNISIVISDNNTDVADYIWTASLTIIVNNPPVIGTMASQTLLAPDGLTWNFGSGLTTDPEGLSFTKSLKFDGSSTIPSWLYYDLSIFDFGIVTSHNNYKGVHNVTVIIQDDFNTAVSSNFTLTILENMAPQKLKFIANQGIVNYNHLLLQFDPITELFADPDNRTLTPEVIQASGDPLPSFLTYNSLTNTLSGTPLLVHVGEWLISYIAIDDHNLTANITFTITVKPCYYKCLNWTGEDYNQCTQCKYGYFLQYNQWKTKCEGSFYENYTTSTCEQCHSYCSTCKDNTRFNCPSCSDGFFYLNDVCYQTCPDGYYGDYTTYTCKKWDFACTKWFGGSRFECTEWNNTALYVLSGTSQWKLATWIVAYYLNETDLNCYPWDTGCNIWEYPDTSYWYQWNSVYRQLSPGTCTHWDEVPGFNINEFGVCVERWGDGLDLGEYEWDDGNSINGDGCSSKCLIEAGYDCNGTYCWEIIKPSASVTSVSTNNLVTVTFSELVQFEDYDTMVENLKTYIDGPSSPYAYNFTLTTSLAANQPFRKFDIQVSGVQATLFGMSREKFKIWFSDLSVIRDLANNTLASGDIVGYLSKFEYIPPATEDSAKSGGSSMKYALISMFSINMVLKMVLSSSAALMWSLIHVLQAFRYILMMNIQMPGLLSILMTYLAVVVGEVDDLEAFMPDFFNTYVVDSDVLNKDAVSLDRFEENGYDSPFLTDLYGKQFTMFFIFIIFGMPAIYIMKRVFTKVKCIREKLQGSWDELFWNAPLRTFTELYVELSLGFFLNSLNIEFMSKSGVIATCILFIAGLYVVLFPFLLLKFVSKPPQYVKSNRFHSKYGTLTEDVFKRKSMYQRSYYILFVFHRLILTSVLVYMYDYPFTQIVIIFTIQMAMIAYMIKARPFRSELQQVIAVSDEFTIIFGMVLLYFLFKNQYDVDKSQTIGMAIIGVVVASFLKNMGTII